VLDYLANSEYAQWVNQSWGWPLALTIHAFGVAIIIGFSAVMGLRMLFGMFRTIPFSSLRPMMPFIWVSLVAQAFSGFTLWMTKPAQYLADGMFEVKFTLVIVASIVAGFFNATLSREAAAWDASGVVSKRGNRLVAWSCVLWAGVTIGGRLTAYLGSLYLR
jgi:hypothetical protein